MKQSSLRAPRARLIPALAISILFSACASFPHDAPVTGLRLIGEQRIALKYPFEGTTVGGLSGIDYDAANKSWVMESDDRSAINPARFYRATLAYDSKAFTGVTLASVHFFTQPDGSRYPNLAHAKLEQGDQVPDIETIRVDPQDGSLWYGSEGNRKVGLDPFVRHADSGGHYLATLPTPAMFKVAKDEIGSRNNMSFEALSFSSDGKSLWLGMEAALYQDAPLATPDHGSVVRITRLDRAGSVLGQYAYPIEPVASRPAPGKEADNGVSEILAVNDHQLLVVERAGVEHADGLYTNHVRIYEMETQGATDIQAIPALAGASYVPARKRLLLDLEKTGLERVDNIEGISWGPRLENGRRSLVMISDDNFNALQVTQILAFEVL
ncbi:esterase-like activity of phytase family protein [Janthinobacterium sp. EB271-G4-7A]|uniref:esterase-like activity of phytase family protein n=1 Tax=Janthinobacterium sp. EB271-G4-7A TaxID=2775056 RepID=UPI001E4A4EB0|nr:esterase-like activity of phytase family protein [Janthinobacterium sp. EB271-G4-7A]MCC7699021.1 esterase-like activity of phytase family protein [Janthinobacterium sp. EB271-G4-7A]